MLPAEMLEEPVADHSSLNTRIWSLPNDHAKSAPFPRIAKSAVDVRARTRMREQIARSLIAFPPMTMPDIATLLNTTASAIRYRHPDEYKQLSERSREYRNKSLEAARQSKQACINSIVDEMHASGVVPSKHRVEAKLQAQNLTMRGAEFSRYFREIKMGQKSPLGIMYTRPKSAEHRLTDSSDQKIAARDKSLKITKT